jgi:uncharacterized repeat protein (TIGR01451 family)
MVPQQEAASLAPETLATEPADLQPSAETDVRSYAETNARSLHGRLENARELVSSSDAVNTASPPGAKSAETITNPAASPTPTRVANVPSRARGGMASAVSNPATAAGSQQVLFEQQGPVLRVHASGPQRIKVGVVSNYSLIVENSGNMDAEAVVVSVRIPPGADLANTQPRDGSARPGTLSDGTPTLEWSIPRLGAHAKSELALGLIPRQNQPFELTATWTHAPVGSLAAIEVQEAKLVMSLTGPEEVFYGERELYKLTLSNPGNGDAENVLVRLLPTAPSDDQAVNHHIGTLHAGENRVVELELTARQVGNLRLRAEAMADGGLLASVDEEVIVRRADLKIDVEGPPLLYAGTVGVYRVHVSNPGNALAKNVQIAAVLPAGARYLNCSDGGIYSEEHGRIVWTTSNLKPGASWSCSYRCELSHPGVNNAQITGIADGDLRQAATIETEVEALADLTLTVKDPPGPMPVGEDVTYEVRVNNRGTKAADQVEVLAYFSPGIEPTHVEGGPYEIGPGQIALAPIASLAPGQEVVFKIRAKAHRSGTHIFRAEVECSALETKLAAEETTRFYGDSTAQSYDGAAPLQPQGGFETSGGADQLVPPPASP